MVPFLLRGFNFWGVKEVGPRWRDTGVILVRYWRDTGLTDCSTYPSQIDFIFNTFYFIKLFVVMLIRCFTLIV